MGFIHKCLIAARFGLLISVPLFVISIGWALHGLTMQIVGSVNQVYTTETWGQIRELAFFSFVLMIISYIIRSLFSSK